MKILFRYALVLTLGLFLSALNVSAQDDGHSTVEGSVTYSWGSFDSQIEDDDFDLENRINTHGFGAAIAGNPHKFVGIKGDFTHHTKSEDFNDGFGTASAKFKVSQFMGGLVFKDHRRSGRRVRPYAQVLAGVAHSSVDLNATILSGGIETRPEGTPTTFAGTFSTNNFAMKFGAGVDVRASKHVSVRILGFDYNPIFFGDQSFDDFDFPGKTQHNVQLSFGIVFHN